MTPEQLKASILQYAIQGKLVEQRPEEGTAEELYKQIQIEKQRLVKEGKIKKEKPLADITDDEIPFDIPENWKWVRLRDICSKIVDGDHNPPAGHNQPTEYLMLSATNINQNKIVELDKVRYVTKDIFEVENQRTNVGINDIFFTIVGSMGRSCVYKGGMNICFQRSVSVLTTLVYPEYLKYMLDSPFIQDFMYRNATGTAQKGFYLKQVENLVVALPPIEEQHRIVAKIEELLPFVDRYAEAYDKLEKLNAKFPEDMKKSILQYAIMGKLVEQRPGEGTAEDLYQQIQEEKQKLIKEGKIKKEKPLADITEDEIPFDIPDNWKWVRLGQCGCFERGSGIKKDEVTPEGFPCVRYGQLYTTYKTRFSQAVSHIPNEVFDKCHKVYKNDILMALTGENEYDIALAVTYEGDEELAMGGDMTRFFGHCMNPIYLTYVINSRYGILCKSKMASGNIIVHISNDKLATIPIPLPPLEEQNRIVDKIEELLPYCDQLLK